MWRRVEEAAAAAIGKYVHVILSKFIYPIFKILIKSHEHIFQLQPQQPLLLAATF